MVNGWRALSKGEKKLVLLGQFLVLASVSADTGVLCDMWVLLKVKKVRKVTGARRCFRKVLEEAISERYKTVEPTVREVVGAEEAALTAQCDGSLTQAGLSGMMISGLAVTPLVKSFMRNVRSLDLSDDLISSWRDVVTLVSSLQNLKVLDLSKNMFDFTRSREARATTWRHLFSTTV
eukprot:jgi/Picre1/28127/NNA_003534.t1